MEELHCIISGRVQMVMFRDFAQRKARGLGLSGWVRNLPDGSVEVLAQGDQQALDGLIEKLRRGPLLARVEKFEVERREPSKAQKGFEIRYS